MVIYCCAGYSNYGDDVYLFDKDSSTQLWSYYTSSVKGQSRSLKMVKYIVACSTIMTISFIYLKMIVQHLFGIIQQVMTASTPGMTVVHRRWSISADGKYILVMTMLIYSLQELT